MAKNNVNPAGPVAPFTAWYDEADRSRDFQGVYGLPNFSRADEDGTEVPVDPERAMSGGLRDAPSPAPNAAPGNANPVKYTR